MIRLVDLYMQYSRLVLQLGPTPILEPGVLVSEPADPGSRVGGTRIGPRPAGSGSCSVFFKH